MSENNQETATPEATTILNQDKPQPGTNAPAETQETKPATPETTQPGETTKPVQGSI